MKFNILTLFPEMFDTVQKSIIGKAIGKGIIEINLINIRDFSKSKHKKVDDTPYGGGAGMVMRADVVYDAYKSIQDEKAKVIYMSPQGKKLNQQKVEELSKEEIKDVEAEIPLMKIGMPEDIADCVYMLIKNEYITGEVIKIDGGWIA